MYLLGFLVLWQVFNTWASKLYYLIEPHASRQFMLNVEGEKKHCKNTSGDGMRLPKVTASKDLYNELIKNEWINCN